MRPTYCTTNTLIDIIRLARNLPLEGTRVHDGEKVDAALLDFLHHLEDLPNSNHKKLLGRKEDVTHQCLP